MAQKILITGGAGFIGHHIIESILKNTDWEIISLDRLVAYQAIGIDYLTWKCGKVRKIG